MLKWLRKLVREESGADVNARRLRLVLDTVRSMQDAQMQAACDHPEHVRVLKRVDGSSWWTVTCERCGADLDVVSKEKNAEKYFAAFRDVYAAKAAYYEKRLMGLDEERA